MRVSGAAFALRKACKACKACRCRSRHRPSNARRLLSRTFVALFFSAVALALASRGRVGLQKLMAVVVVVLVAVTAAMVVVVVVVVSRNAVFGLVAGIT